MPKRYDKLGIRFQYPDNWTLDEAEAAESGESISVYSPGGAFWTVAIRPDDSDPNELADQALAAMREEYEDLESEPVEEQIAGHTAIGYNLNFWYLDLFSTSFVRCIPTEQATFLVFCQTEDRELAENTALFRAMTTSLLRG